MIRIVTDSTCDLPADLLARYRIRVVPINIQFGQESFQENVTLGQDEFYRKVAALNQIPTTSQPSLGQFARAYQAVAAEENTGAILSLHITGHLSGTYHAAVVAAGQMPETPPITVFDSLSGSMGLGFMVLEAAQLAEAGATMAEVLARLEEIRQRMCIFLSLDNLRFARMSGRVGKVQEMLASLLSVKPMLTVQAGKLELVNRARSRSQALAGLINALGDALAKWGAWINAFGAQEYGRPIFIASSADLAASTNISGFAEAFGEFKGYGWYERVGTDEGALLPQEITEFANSGIMAGIAGVNLATNPEEEFDGFWAASSTYGSFSYLLYGPMRLFSQLSQDCELKVGKVLWVAGHSGPETAEDSRTHFGIFAPGVTQLFPEGQIINLHPWEYNEVPVLLAAALATDVPIVALHLTRPPITIPDRARLGIPSHFEAARGAYVMRDYKPGRPCDGTFIVQGTSAVNGIVQILPRLDELDLNVKIVCATSRELFDRQPEAYRNAVLPPEARQDLMFVMSGTRRMWPLRNVGSLTDAYSLTADQEDRWLTGGTEADVIAEARLDAGSIAAGVERFARERPQRLARQRAWLDALGSSGSTRGAG